MKFGKEFAAQMVPEWQEAYMNYSYLKSLIKDIQHSKQRNKPTTTSTSTTPPPHHIKRKLTLYRAFSGLTRSRHHQEPISSSPGDIENQAIIVHHVRPSEGSSHQSYQTTFLMVAEEGGVKELEYFKRDDDEFNKVDKFYRGKVEEVMKEAAVLNKQMDALIAFRIKVEHPYHERLFDWSGEMTRLASDVAASTAQLAASTPRGAGVRGRAYMATNVIVEDESSSQGEQYSGDDDKEKEELHVDEMVKVEKPEKIRRPRPAPLDVLNRVTMNQTVETPRSTIKGFLNVPQQTDLKFSRGNLNKVEKQLKRAFVIFYHKLRLLKSFGFLNTLAFSKIMKKYDKVTSRNTSKSYMKMVDNSYLGSSDEVTKLIERVESAFIKHFSNSNRRKGMAVLRPKRRIERHRITFLMGCFAGCTVALILALILIYALAILCTSQGGPSTWIPYFLYTVVLHMLMYAGNIYFWRRYRVNYSFIFGFKQGTELGYREVLLVSFGLTVLALAAVLSNLDMEMDPKTKDYKQFTELLPLFLVLVTLPDFLLADQFTSQVQAIRSLQFYICYYGWGDYKHRETSCRSSDVFNTFSFIVACIPYWSRLFQCLRRLFEEKDAHQGYNGLKYFFTIVAVTMRTAYSLNKDVKWKILAGVFSVIAAVSGTYWDLVIDWGLLQHNSKNRWLRDKLLVPYTSVYFGAMVLNVLLRFAWLQTVLDFNVSFMHRQTMIAVVASLEIIRRGVWNFFRLENEHLNNVGKYRAFKSVPLPFNYDEDHNKNT
ncbi:hypothetical protein ACLB2K_034641 [Fragaria x ananassa]